MAGNFLSLSKDKRFRFWGFGLVFISLVSGLVGLIFILKFGNETISVSHQHNTILPMFMLLTGFLVLTLFVFYLLFILTSWRKETEFSSLHIDSSVITRDCQSLSAAMAELAQGNLSVRLSIQAQPLELTKSDELNQFIVAFNTIIQSLKNTATEFNKLTDIHCLRLCYVGADSFLEGRKCGEVLAEAIGGRGKVVISTGSFNASGLELRRIIFRQLKLWMFLKTGKMNDWLMITLKMK